MGLWRHKSLSIVCSFKIVLSYLVHLLGIFSVNYCIFKWILLRRKLSMSEYWVRFDSINLIDVLFYFTCRSCTESSLIHQYELINDRKFHGSSNQTIQNVKCHKNPNDLLWKIDLLEFSPKKLILITHKKFIYITKFWHPQTEKLKS